MSVCTDFTQTLNVNAINVDIISVCKSNNSLSSFHFQPNLPMKSVGLAQKNPYTLYQKLEYHPTLLIYAAIICNNDHLFVLIPKILLVVFVLHMLREIIRYAVN